jgi:hypothetical protein
METKTHLGMNKTGVQMSPMDSSEMLEGLEQFGPQADADREDLRVRMAYADATEGLGSVPVPGTFKGMMKSGADMIGGSRPQVLVDKLGERLAFERAGVRLYDTLLAKCSAATDTVALSAADRESLGRFRDEEAQHAQILVSALETLGADPTAQTPCADLVGVQGMGLIQAMNDPRTSLVQSLNVMLSAELLDNSGWELLIELAGAAGHDEIARRCTMAATQEAEHLDVLRDMVRQMVLRDASLTGSAMAAEAAGTGAP